MAKVVYKSYNRNEGSLFPVYLSDMVPAGHPARVVDAVVDSLDISEIERGYKGGGASSYEPRALLKVIFYSYLDNVYSGRQMERLWRENIVYMWLGGTLIPDFRTINNFRSRRLVGTFESLFTQVVMLLHEEGLVSLKVQYVDGTKIESAANKFTFVWKKATETNKEKLEKNVRAVLEAAERALEMEQREVDGGQPMTAEEMAERTGRVLEKMQEKQEALGKEQRKAVKKVADESVDKMREYERKLDTLGDRNSYSKTDPDATFMRMKEDAMNNGQTKPGYNLQIGTENQFITDFGFFPNPTDTLTMIPFLTSFSDRYGRFAKQTCADSGYGSEENYSFMESNDIEAYVKYNLFHKEQKRAFKKDIFRIENLYYNPEGDYFICPMGQHMERAGVRCGKTDSGYKTQSAVYRATNCEGCPLRWGCYKRKQGNREIEVNHRLMEYKRKARERLTSERGLEHRSNRPIEPEAVFGQMKYNMQYKRFRHFGKDKIIMDFAFFAIAFNIKKMAAKLRKTGYMNDIKDYFMLYGALNKPICCILQQHDTKIIKMAA